MTAQSAYAQLVDTMQRVRDINCSAGVLQWDSEVNAPPGSFKFRGRQVATLSGLAHDMFANEHVGQLIEKSQEAEQDELNLRNIELINRSYQHEKKFDRAFVERQAALISESFHAWHQAKSKEDFSLFEGPLQKIIELRREEVEILGYDDHPYDALLDQYEPDTKTAEVKAVFEDLKPRLIALINKLKAQPQVDNSLLHEKYDRDLQWHYGLDVLRKMGYDFTTGRQDIAAHPFMTALSPSDVRVTTRINENDLANMLFSCIHEGGHALYEQGLDGDMYGLPLGEAISLGIHESQSRLWENNVGRSKVYWQANFADLQQRFPRNLASVDVDTFYRAINKVEPGFIRTEADELHYHLHVMIRFEIELGMIDGSLNAADLPAAWNEKYKEYLGLDVPKPSKGVLQDIHWSHGSIGYFATYSLGSLYAAQFFAQAEKDISKLTELIAANNTKPLLDWLRDNIHQHGKRYSATDLCKRITGEPLNADYFMTYAEKKYEVIYSV